MSQTVSDQAVYARAQPDAVPLGITDAGLSAWSRPSSTAAKTGDESVIATGNRGMNQGSTTFDFAEQDIYAAPVKPAGDIQLAALNPGIPDKSDTRVSRQTEERLGEISKGLANGDIRELQLYVRDMNHAMFWDPAKGKDMQAGMQELLKEFNSMHIAAKLVNGELTLTMPGKDGKSLTIDKNGRPNLDFNDLQDFKKNLHEYIFGKDTPQGSPMSDKTIKRLDSIENGLKQDNIKGLTDALKEIADKINSIKPGAAGEKERKEAKDLQEMLGALGYEFSSKNVDARYDAQSGNFKITQPDANGQMETLTIDKFGRPNMSGQQLQDFLARWQKNLKSPQETIVV